jgi:hypothetical protein
MEVSMAKNRIKILFTITFTLSYLFFSFTGIASAGILGDVGDFIKHPRIKISHKGKDITIQTTKPLKRAIQIGCIVSTGDVYGCAKDVIHKNTIKALENVGLWPFDDNNLPSNQQIEEVARESCKTNGGGPNCEKGNLLPAMHRMIPPFFINHTGVPSGFALGACGCWGAPRFPNGFPMVPGQWVPDGRCTSGYSSPLYCGYACPMGGGAWAAVCR